MGPIVTAIVEWGALALVLTIGILFAVLVYRAEKRTKELEREIEANMLEILKEINSAAGTENYGESEDCEQY